MRIISHKTVVPDLISLEITADEWIAIKVCIGNVSKTDWEYGIIQGLGELPDDVVKTKLYADMLKAEKVWA